MAPDDTPFIEHYEFGQIRIAGQSYSDDVILLDREVVPGWWREEGHSLHREDLEKVIAFDPALLVIGTGAYGRMSVPRPVVNDLPFPVEVHPTEEACRRYNALLDQKDRIAAGFHLTC
jgi:hypothetical protein